MENRLRLMNVWPYQNIGNILVFTPEDTLIEGSDKTESNYVKTYGPKYQIRTRIILKLEINHR